MIFNFSVGSLNYNFTLIHYYNFMGITEKIDSMGGENAGFVFKVTEYNILKNIFSNFSIKGWDWIVHEINVTATIDCSGKANSSFLSTTQVYTSFSNLSKITGW